MEFTIKSKYDKGSEVSTKSHDKGVVVMVDMSIVSLVVKIKYLVEFHNLERKWIDENSLL